MQDRLQVRPKEGLKVRDASGRPIPPEGADVVRSRYISRRLQAGDLELPPAPSPKPAKAKSKVAKAEGGEAS